MTSFKIVTLKPYHPVLGWLLHPVAQRLLEHVRKLGESEAVVYDTMSRVWNNDPNVLILACVNNKSEVKGHAVAFIDNGEAYLMQPRIDEPTDRDTIGEMIGFVDKWVKEYNTQVGKVGINPIKDISMVARRSDPKWAKRYNFETTRYVMRRPLGE